LWPHARPARLRPKPVCDKHGLPPNTKKQEKNNSKPKHSLNLWANISLYSQKYTSTTLLGNSTRMGHFHSGEEGQKQTKMN